MEYRNLLKATLHIKGTQSQGLPPSHAFPTSTPNNGSLLSFKSSTTKGFGILSKLPLDFSRDVYSWNIYTLALEKYFPTQCYIHKFPRKTRL